MPLKKFRIKVLDFKYLPDYEHLNFRYQIYDVEAMHEQQAVKKARENYMKGHEPLYYEEFPFQLKLFSVEHGRSSRPF